VLRLFRNRREIVLEVYAIALRLFRNRREIVLEVYAIALRLDYMAF